MKKAIIYVRGHNQEMQEVSCRLYALDNKYKVLFVTTHIEEVNGCDILLVSNLSRISRNRFECETTIKELKFKGIEVKSIANVENTCEFEALAKTLLNQKEGLL